MINSRADSFLGKIRQSLRMDGGLGMTEEEVREAVGLRQIERMHGMAVDPALTKPMADILFERVLPISPMARDSQTEQIAAELISRFVKNRNHPWLDLLRSKYRTEEATPEVGRNSFTMEDSLLIRSEFCKEDDLIEILARCKSSYVFGEVLLSPGFSLEVGEKMRAMEVSGSWGAVIPVVRYLGDRKDEARLLKLWKELPVSLLVDGLACHKLVGLETLEKYAPSELVKTVITCSVKRGYGDMWMNLLDQIEKENKILSKATIGALLNSNDKEIRVRVIQMCAAQNKPEDARGKGGQHV